MILVDVTVMLAAFRQDHAHHALARPWLEQNIKAGTGILVPDAVWVGFVRLVTNSHIFEVPSTPTEAFGFVDAVRASPGYANVAGLDDIGALRDTVIAADAWGNLIPDAYLAAVALSHAVPVASFDRDFRRFDGLKIVVPSD